MARKRKKNQRTIQPKESVVRFDFREIGKLLAVAVIVMVGVWGMKKIENVSIKTVEIQSKLTNVSKDEVRMIAENFIQEGFFTVDLLQFEEELNSIPWVYKANIKRQWPGKLAINIYEQKPLFRWGKSDLVNDAAETFRVQDTREFSHLPYLKGVVGREQYLVNLYYRYEDNFSSAGVPIVRIEEDARYDKVITLANGISINVGRERAEQQIERCLYSFAMFSKAERAAISSIDFRHSNGFAVRWNG